MAGHDFLQWNNWSGLGWLAIPLYSFETKQKNNNAKHCVPNTTERSTEDRLNPKEL
jgi:hypothetical protein